MQKLNLFLHLMEITHQLIKEGVTIDNAHYALMEMDSAFDDFEQNEGVGVSDVQLEFQEVFFTLKYMPKELLHYFQTIQTFNNQNNENDIYLKPFPPQFRAETSQQVQFISGLFNILNTLLWVGITSCNNHQARTEILELFEEFEKQEDLRSAQHLTKILDENESEKNLGRFLT